MESAAPTRRSVTRKRISIQEEKDAAGKLGPETVAVIPDDIVVMYAGKLCDLAIKGSVRAANIQGAYLRSYPFMDENVAKHLADLEKDFNEVFEKTKKRTIAIAEQHPLWKRLGGIRGFSAYQLALLMCYIKDISRFETGSNLMVYAGLAAIRDHATGKDYPVTKANINKIKEIYFANGKIDKVPAVKISAGDSILIENEIDFFEVKEVVLRGETVHIKMIDSEDIAVPDTQIIARLKEFHGFNTALSGRLLGESTIVDCLLRAKGYFYTMYKAVRERLVDRCMNGDECTLATKEDEKPSGGKMKVGRYYMKGKKNQSLEAFTDSNAKRRVARTFLYLLWAEWRKLKGLSVRNGYAIDYLGHKHWITLDEVLVADARVKDEN